MKSTAQNMQLCGMPSTQVQRAARRIAAGTFLASEYPDSAGPIPRAGANGPMQKPVPDRLE
jgi:hypothetical protein